jgi:hypothetical protein
MQVKHCNEDLFVLDTWQVHNARTEARGQMRDFLQNNTTMRQIFTLI